MVNPLKYFRNRKVGLALGSGGAKGIAHIAVIEYLEKEDIPINMIAGSSAGALMGAIYCAGTLSKFKNDLLAIPKKDFLGFVDLILPVSGLVGTDKIMSWLENYIPPDLTIEKLRIPLAIVATDYFTGKPIVFTKGNVLSAVRASISLPGIFIPVKHKETLLIDGGVANPLPIDILKKMGAGLTIAVNLHPGLKPREARKKSKQAALEITNAAPRGNGDTFLNKVKQNIDSMVESGWLSSVTRFFENRANKNDEKYPSIFESIMRTIDIMELINTTQLLSYHSPNVLIEPNLLQLGSLDFYKGKEALEEGKASCDRVRKKIIQNVKNWV